MKQQAFTLVEILVTVAAVVLVSLVATAVMLNGFKAKTSINLADVVDRNGSFALGEIRRSVINSVSGAMICPVGVGWSLTVMGQDGLASRIVCEDGVRIASESSLGNIDLLDGQVKVSGCASFVGCSLGDGGLAEQVSIGFTLTAGNSEAGPEAYVQKSFSTKVTARD